jgi:hypothetical protein
MTYYGVQLSIYIKYMLKGLVKKIEVAARVAVGTEELRPHTKSYLGRCSP